MKNSDNIFTLLEETKNSEPVRPVKESIKDCEEKILFYANLIIEDPVTYERFANAIVTKTKELAMLKNIVAEDEEPKKQYNVTSFEQMGHEYAGEELIQSTKISNGNFINVFYVSSKNIEEFENFLNMDDNVREYKEI